MDVSGSQPLDGDQRVDESPRRNCGVAWPLAVDARLEELVRRANAAGERTNRRELLSAIVCAFDPEPDEFSSVLRAYRTMTVAQVALTEPDADNVVHIKRFGPGPRRSGS